MKIAFLIIFAKKVPESFAVKKKVCIFAPDLETNHTVDVAQSVRVEDCGS